MATLREILTDKANYADDEEITLKNGQKVTIKDLRDGAIPRDDYTREGQRWASEKQQLTEAANGLQAQLREEIARREAAGTQPEPTRGTGERVAGTRYKLDDLREDPAFGPVVEEILETRKYIKALEERAASHETTWLKNQYEGQLERIRGYHDGKFNKDGKGKPFDQEQFLAFVKQNPISRNGLVDFGLCYREYARQDEIEYATREAEERGVERGRKAAAVPKVPFGNRRGVAARDKNMPANLQSLTTEMVLEDPDIQAALRGDDQE